MAENINILYRRIKSLKDPLKQKKLAEKLCDEIIHNEKAKQRISMLLTDDLILV